MRKEVKTKKQPIELKNSPLSAVSYLKGTYSLSTSSNGKPSWISASYAIWYKSGQWRIGKLEDRGKDGFWIYSTDKSGVPNDQGNEWFYHDGKSWVTSALNDISVQCITKIEGMIVHGT